MGDGDSDNHSNAAFADTPAEEDWIEIFHSRRSWATTQISFSADGAPWVPFGKFELIDASAIKAGFRVFRIRARELRLKLADGRGGETDSNRGTGGYVVDAPGRYVIESGCRRVGDAQIADCLQALRPRDQFVELTFRPARPWRACFVTYALFSGTGGSGEEQRDSVPAKERTTVGAGGGRGGEEDAQWLMVPMNRCAVRDGAWVATIDARRGMDCAFTDGGDEWESNESCNFLIRVPGRYTVEEGRLRYGGVSALDLHMCAGRNVDK